MRYLPGIEITDYHEERFVMDEKFKLLKLGDIIVREFLAPVEITPYRLAKDLRLSISSILYLIHNKRKISVEMALRLSKYFGISSKFWLNMQNELDLKETREKLESVLDKIPSCKRTAKHPISCDTRTSQVAG